MILVDTASKRGRRGRGLGAGVNSDNVNVGVLLGNRGNVVSKGVSVGIMSVVHEGDRALGCVGGGGSLKHCNGRGDTNTSGEEQDTTLLLLHVEHGGGRALGRNNSADVDSELASRGENIECITDLDSVVEEG